MDNDIRTLISDTIGHLHPEVSDSAGRLISAGRIYEAAYSLMSVTGEMDGLAIDGLDDKVNGLIDTMSRKYGTVPDLAVRARLLSAMYGLINGTSIVADPDRSDRWYGDADELISQYIASPYRSSGHDSLICRCITDYLYFTASDDGENAYLTFLLDTVADWAGSFDPGLGWKGLPLDDALNRIEVMDRISYMMLYRDWENVTGEAFSCYMDKADSCEALPLATLGLIYDLQSSASLSAGSDTSSSAARTAEEIQAIGEAFPDGSDERVFAKSYMIKESCERKEKKLAFNNLQAFQI